MLCFVSEFDTKRVLKLSDEVLDDVVAKILDIAQSDQDANVLLGRVSYCQATKRRSTA